MADVDTLNTKITEKLGQFILNSILSRGELTLEIKPENLHEMCIALRDDPEFDFQMLIDVCGVDYLHYGITEWATESTTATGFSRGVMPKKENHFHFIETEPPTLPTTTSYQPEAMLPDGRSPKKYSGARFAAVYHLLSLNQNHRVRLRVFLDSHHPKVASVLDIWSAANWFEREAFDLFGIEFTGHPDLRRILTDYGFIGHPFRKDFPLIGNVEVRYDANLRRVVYEPVSIEPRVLEPKVIRDDNRYQVGE